MYERTVGGNQAPEFDQHQGQISGSVFNDPTAPFWDGPTTPAPTTRADRAPSGPVESAPAPPKSPVPPPPPAPTPEHRPKGAAYRNLGAESTSMDPVHRPTGAAYRNHRQPALPTAPDLIHAYPQSPPAPQPTVRQHAPLPDPYSQPPRKDPLSGNAWTIMRILSILGVGGSFGGLVLAFFELKKASQGSEPSGSQGSGRSRLLTRIALIVFILACLAGTGSFLIHRSFPF